LITFLFQKIFGENDVLAFFFKNVHTTRGHTSTWQFCCGVGVVSAAICGQYVR